MQNYFEIVQTAERQLRAEGHPFTGTTGDAAASDRMKGLLNARAALLCHQVNGNIGLLRKDGGANYDAGIEGGVKVSTDTLLDRSDGSSVDTGTTTENGDGTFTVVAIWNPGGGEDTNRWVQPSPELAQVADGGAGSGGGGTPGGGGGGTDGGALQAKILLEALADVTLMVQGLDGKLSAHMQQTSHFNLFGLGTTTIHPDAPAAETRAAMAALAFPPITLPANVSLADLLKAIQTIAAVIVAIQQMFAPREMQP